MKIIIKIGYLLTISFIIGLFILEYKNYIHTNQTISIRSYQEQLDRIRNNSNVIKQYYQTNQNQSLKPIIEFCYRFSSDLKLLDLKSTDLLNFADIYNLGSNSTSGGCHIAEKYYMNEKIQNIYSEIKYDDLYFYEYFDLISKNDLKKDFEAILNREEQTMAAFIKSIQIILEEEGSN